jgi:hypothetical protein
VEAAVVVYLRTIGEPIRAHAGLPAGSLFPLTSIRQMGAFRQLVNTELLREAATLLMLAAVAGVAQTRGRAGRVHGWLPAFALAFGVWDLAFYASLQALIGWPGSLFTWDLLFLLPVPWSGPVLAPVIVAASLTIGGILAMIRGPARAGWIPWTLLCGGGAALLLSFMWDWRLIVGGGVPSRFPWGIFAIGEVSGVLGLWCALRESGCRAAGAASLSSSL